MQSDSAIVFIEFQNEWLDDSGKLNDLMLDSGQFERAFERAEEALRTVRENERAPDVIHCGLRFDSDYAELGSAEHGLRGAIPEAETWLGSGQEFVEPFTPRDGEFVVRGRTGASAFAGSNLDSYLRNNRIERVYLAGFALHVCILATLCQGHDLGYEMIVLDDACAAFTTKQQETIVEDVIHHFGTHLSVDEFNQQVAEPTKA